MKKIYSFLTAVFMVFIGLSASAATVEVSACLGTYSEDTRYVTYCDEVVLSEEATVEGNVITFTNFLGSGQQISFACYTDGSAEIVNPVSYYVKGTYTVGSLGTLTGVYFGNSIYSTREYYDDKDGKGLLFKTWVKGDADKLYYYAKIPEELTPAAPPALRKDPRWSTDQGGRGDEDWGFYDILHYDNLIRIQFSEDVTLDFTVTEVDGNKYVTLAPLENYKIYDHERDDYIYIFNESGYIGHGTNQGYDFIYLYIYFYDIDDYDYFIFYYPDDEWADIEAVDAKSYSYGNASRTYSTGTDDPWNSATSTIKAKWNLDKKQLLLPDYLGSKQDLLVVYDDSAVTSLWSLSEYWYPDYNGWYDDAEEPIVFYPWFDTVNKSSEYYLYPSYSSQSLSTYNNIVLSSYVYYTEDSSRESQYEYTYIYGPTLSGGAAVKDIEAVDNSNAPVEYFNLQGVRVANPENGLFIRRQGSKVSKVVVK